MRGWRLTIITMIVILAIVLLLSFGGVALFNAIIWPHLPMDSRSVIASFGPFFISTISIIAILVAIPASIVQVRQRFDNPDQIQRAVDRQRFAEKRLQILRELDRAEDWQDYRFTELEAELGTEVEAEGRRKTLKVLSFLGLMHEGLRHEKSLSKALASSREKYILIEGDPGSGKSVALRHIAEMMLARASEVRSTKSMIPVYVNLRELKPPSVKPIDRNLIETHVLEVLREKVDADVERFLDEQFAKGIIAGTWFFLFDSFDELPDILSSTDTDAVVKSYEFAISDFLSKPNNCRGILASRQFHGPKFLNWPRFRILRLSERRQIKLIHRMQLQSKVEQSLRKGLETASEGIHFMGGNPLFLGLLCKHMKRDNPFPQAVDDVFRTYVESRLDRDKERLKKHYNLDRGQVQITAENIAFCMNAEPGLGLSPSRDQIKNAMAHASLAAPRNLDTFLDALEYMKLARRGDATGTAPQTFTFAHRRLQEYLATCVVRRDPSRLSPRLLLTDGRWRETAVAMCQNQPLLVLKPLLDEAEKLIGEFCNSIPNLINDPLSYIRKTNWLSRHFGADYFPWPDQSEHVLKLLQEGFSERLMDLPDSIRLSIGKFLLSATESEILSDEKRSLDVAGTAPEAILVYLLKHAFASPSQWLKDAAYGQVARLGNISPDIATGIRDAISRLSSDGRLYRERHTTKAYLDRTNQSPYFYSIMRLLLWLPLIDVGLHIVLFVLTLFALLRADYPPIIAIPLFGILLISHGGLRLIMGPLRYSRWLFVVVPLLRLPLAALLLTGWLTKYFVIPPGTLILFITVIAAALYIALFSPFALIATEIGKFTRPQWWILLPLWPILYVFTDEGCLISLAVTVGLGAVLTGIVFLILFLAPAHSQSQSQSPTNTGLNAGDYIGIAIGIIIIVVTLIIAVTIVCRWVYEWIHDWLWSNRWHRKNMHRKGQMSCQEMYTIVSEFYGPSFCLQALKTIRERDLLQITEETEDSLRKIALMAQRKPRNRGRDPTRYLNSLRESKEGITLVRNSNPDIVDELYKLSEHVRIVRQSSTTP